MDAAFRCLHCDSTKAEAFYRDCPDYYLGKPFRVDYLRCTSCGLVQQSPVPLDVSAFYEAYPVHARKSRVHEVSRRIMMSPVYFDASSLPRGSVLLDFGCGDGWYLDSLADLGLERVGFEPDAAHAERLSRDLGIPVFGDADALLEGYAGRCDVVTMHFVVEHLTSLRTAFAQVAALLKPGGTFYFVVPDISSWESRLFGRKWHNLDAPRHISFPGRDVAASLAADHGLTLTGARPRPFPNGVAGSLPVVLTGRFVYPLFLLSLPIGLLASRIAPSGAVAFTAEKGPAEAGARR